MVLWGRCREAGAPALWPWSQIAVEARRAGLSGFEIVWRRQSRGRGSVSPSMSGHDRFERFDGMVQALVGVASTRPLAVVIDDLQWADADSFELLTFLAADIVGVVCWWSPRSVRRDGQSVVGRHSPSRDDRSGRPRIRRPRGSPHRDPGRPARRRRGPSRWCPDGWQPVLRHRGRPTAAIIGSRSGCRFVAWRAPRRAAIRRRSTVRPVAAEHPRRVACRGSVR